MKTTINIADLVLEVNRKNRVSTCNTMLREGWNALLETVLIEAGVYVGSEQLSEDDLPKGQFPDIHRRIFKVHESLQSDYEEKIAKLNEIFPFSVKIEVSSKYL